VKKKLLIAFVVVLVVIVAGGLLVYSNLDKIIKVGVEKGGTMVLGVSTTLEGATVDVPNGTVGLDGLLLGSPEGFSEPGMFKLGHAHTTVDLGSIRKDELIIREVVIDGPEITLEFDGTRTNWGTLLENLESEPKQEEARKKSQKSVRVDRIVFSNGKVRIAGVPAVGGATVPLPRLEITDLAPADGTVQTVGGVLADVVRSLYTSVVGAAGSVLPLEQVQALGQEALAVAGQAAQAATEAAGAAASAAKDAAGSAAEAAKDAGAAAAGAAKSAGDKATGLIRGVLPGGKDEPAEADGADEGE